MAVETQRKMGQKEIREAERLIEEEEKLAGTAKEKGLLTVVSRGLGQITGFLIDSQRKKETVDRIALKLEDNLKKLDSLYGSTGDFLLRRSIRDGLEELKEIYSVNLMEIERIYASKSPVEMKLVDYKEIEESTVRDMDTVMSRLKSAMGGQRGS
jgi:hypothetical protein